MSSLINARFAIQFGLGLVFLLLAAALAYVFSSIAATIALSVVAYLILDAPTKALEHKGVSRSLALGVIVLVSSIVFFGSVLILGPGIYSDIQAITGGLPSLRERSLDLARSAGMFGPIDLSSFITPEILGHVQSYLLSIISSSASFLGEWLFNVIVIVPLLTLLLLSTGDSLKDAFLSRVPNVYFELSVTILDQMVKTVREYVFARFMETLVVGAMCVIGFLLIGLPGAIVLGTLAGILNLIPYIGPLLSVFPPLIMALVTQSTSLAIWAVIVISIAQIIDNTVFQTVLLSRLVDVDPIVVIIITSIGAQLLGAVGMVIAIPVYTISKILVLSLYQFLQSVQRHAAFSELEPSEPQKSTTP
ncbi:MAG TPA: AI-2E family transporter [Candidatus Nanoarchaeia archaeon]|nr:AI-2E family transporter [Candidatus Nanoarchaeia archaeon]